jgi:hypothetical protein
MFCEIEELKKIKSIDGARHTISLINPNNANLAAASEAVIRTNILERLEKDK